MTYECLECGMVFESGGANPECPNEETGLETHAVRLIAAGRIERGNKRRTRFRLFGRR
jgi:hypothetical protein